jgi:prolipoprotein diacylglyceryl transferase
VGVLVVLLGAIPSPPDSAVHIGPLQLRAYGVAIAVGVATAIVIAQRRWADRGGDPSDITRLAGWCVGAGLVGARAYHVITDYQRFEGQWLDAFKVWQGGLGIPGALLAGVIAGVIVARHRSLPVGQLLDVAAPAIPVGQAIGRLGNWFNQELYGRPTDLPWALRIDVDHRPDELEHVATYHPTFLYEGLWNLALAAGLVLYERRRPNGRPGRLFALYVAGYGLGRFWVEALRIDPASEILGVRVNLWVSLIAVAGALGWLVLSGRQRGPIRDGSGREGT